MSTKILDAIKGMPLWGKILSGVIIALVFFSSASLIADQVEQMNYAGVSYVFAKSEDQTRRAFQDSSAQQDFSTEQIQAITGYKLMVYHVVVQPTSKAQIEPTVQKIIDDLTSEDGTIDEIVLHFYSNSSLVEQGQTWDIASAVWGPNGEHDSVTASIAKNDERETYQTSIEYGGQFQ